MTALYVEFSFLLDNGRTKIITVKDLKEDVTNSELLALADKFIALNSHSMGSKFTTLKKCEKYTVNIEEVL
ncbi:MAG: DUF2922 domain-containing protein [Oscillospiraceae bacterium]|nr:DUF2922 domain-containing protein [Oscillospiraceae bacterium]